jgi:hypothetical protein
VAGTARRSGVVPSGSVSALKERELHRGGLHPKIGHLRINNLLHEWIYHDLNHISQIHANVQSFLWAHLGNMQRFYQPQHSPEA